jgi:6-phosphogluconolactonase
MAKPARVRVYVGTYTTHGSKGIYRLQLDVATGGLATEGEPTETANPSYLALHPNRRFLYAVNELGESRHDQGGAVSAFAIDPPTGALAFLGRQPSGGAAPCHLSLDAQGGHLLVANYWGGSVRVFPVGPDGPLAPATATVQHEGRSVNPERQEGPHAHSINLDPAGRFAFAADLGLDQVRVYRFDRSTGSLLPHDPSAARVAPGSGPRHLAFHPDGRHAYVINELDSTITAFGYDAAKGALAELHTVSTLPAAFSGSNITAEVAVRADGRFLYGSNRGHDSIAIFAIDASTGRLTALGHQPARGKTPRHFAIDPTGTWMLAANQDSDDVVVFRVDEASGRLEPVGGPTSVPRPVCVRMVVPD